MEAFTWSDLVRRTGSERRARTALAQGEYRRVCRGAYADAVHPDGLGLRVEAARLVLPPGAALSGPSALWLIGVPYTAADTLHVTVPRGRHLQPRAHLTPHSADLPERDLCEVGGLLVTSAARAVADIARSRPLIEAVELGDAALRAGATTLAALEASLELAAGLRGVRRARLVVPHLEPRSESPRESRLRMTLVLGGLRRPQAQLDVYDAQGQHVGRVDLHVDGVAIEYDGFDEHTGIDSFGRDRRRHNALSELGLEVRRFTAVDLRSRSGASLVAEVTRAVEQAAGRDRSAVHRGPDTLRRPRLQPLPTLDQLHLRRSA